MKVYCECCGKDLDSDWCRKINYGTSCHYFCDKCLDRAEGALQNNQAIAVEKNNRKNKKKGY